MNYYIPLYPSKFPLHPCKALLLLVNPPFFSTVTVDRHSDLRLLAAILSVAVIEAPHTWELGESLVA